MTGRALRVGSAEAASPVDRVIRRRIVRRLAVQAAAIVAAIVVLLTAAAVAVVVDSQSTAADLTLTTALARADDVGDPPANTYLAIRGGDGAVATTPAAPAGLPDLGALDRTTATGITDTTDLVVDGRSYRVLTERLGPRTVQGALDLATNHQERDRLVATLLVAGLIGLSLAAVAGAWLGARAVAPLDDALATQRRFVADASHELRTPLTLLSTRAQMLRRRLDRPDTGERARREADAVVSDSAHLAAILDDLLLAADPRTGRTDGDDDIDLADLVGAVVASCTDDAASRGVVLGHERPAARLPTAGSATALRRAITALVDNGIRHAHGHVAVVVTRSNGALHVDVRDDGDGVDPRVAPYMFDRFATHHGDPPSTSDPRPDETGAGSRRTRGYGIGLALVAGIAAAHGGTVTSLGTPPGSGALLRLTLPARPDREDGVTPASRFPLVRRPRKRPRPTSWPAGRSRPGDRPT